VLLVSSKAVEAVALARKLVLSDPSPSAIDQEAREAMDLALDEHVIERMARAAGLEVSAERLATIVDELNRFQPLVAEVMSTEVEDFGPEMRYDPAWPGGAA
jgi:hypothetical protein